MKNIIDKSTFLSLFILLICTHLSFGQSAIGKFEVEGEDVLLDFKEDDNRGIILSWVTKQDDVLDPEGGTLIYDANDKKVKYYMGGTVKKWEDLSVNTGLVDTSIQAGLVDERDPTIIGSQASTAKGALILEANDKAMVLPKMNSPHLNIKSPAAGTIVYDKVSKMLCVFNGKEWAFWKVDN
ncbi:MULTISPECIES: hypothetical protein [Myroides]|uniref:Uncharacterized protein n=1 Tax=Myroides albus TaxID=2562892 RepID=A0A6I3LNT0_9FLAO|nr:MULTISPECIES: hypothetical protein [Myroides]MTG99417.1 hypothetical protein [Myroides albus]MVX37006.1 hypothetical protein [Myroides sp. LoEW2-1]UVD78688.1 hypothetical protein NWE55_11210 [Myroides albus]